MKEKLNKKIEIWDRMVIHYSKNWSVPFSRFALFVVYFYFGALKVFSVSPANPLVSLLLERTMPFMTFYIFIVLFGLFEMLIGILFMVPAWTRYAVPLLIIHLVTTIMPLFLLTSSTWQSFMVPTLEGQYIIKNILIVAIAVGISAQLHTLRSQK